MKLALLYTVWTGDDMEMLRRSIIQHEPFVDGILISDQRTSNKGEYDEPNNDKLSPFPSLGYLSNKVWFKSFEPDLSKNTKENERIKHDMMIQTAKNNGFTHFIMCACDHFYTPEHFEFGKEYHKKHDIDVSFTMMRTYYKHENWYLDPMEYYYMPFIHRMSANTAISKDVKYPVKVDPSVKVNNCVSWRVFTPEEVLLHHYSMVRKDIERKLRNAASSIRWKKEQVEKFIKEYNEAKPGDEISYFQGRKIVELQE